MAYLVIGEKFVAVLASGELDQTAQAVLAQRLGKVVGEPARGQDPAWIQLRPSRSPSCT
jgi:hypothetical protein